MPTTPILKLPYPAAGDPADVPTDMRELAERIEATSAPFYRAEQSGSLALTTSAQAIPGSYLTLAEVGYWLVLATFDFFIGNLGVGICVGTLGGSATPVGAAAQALMSESAIRSTVAQNWVVQTTAAGQTVGLNANKTAAAGSVSVYGPSTTIRVIPLQLT
jgi:hypothetical protein